MSFFDLISDLRKGVPDIGEAARARRGTLGTLCPKLTFWIKNDAMVDTTRHGCDSGHVQRAET
jgi:hypothetical protein